MYRFGLFKPKFYVGLLNYVGVPSIIIYFVFMCVVPWFYGDWDYVHGVWLDWQTLNTGVLAFLSSITAFNISSVAVEKQRQRDFVASRALLPQKLDDLCQYLNESATSLQGAYYHSKNRSEMSEIAVPKLSDAHFETFQECIRHATPEVGDYLAKVLNMLQVHGARLESVCKKPQTNRRYYNTLFFGLAELKVSVDDLFPLARGEEDNISGRVDKESISRALHILGIYYENTENLESYVNERVGKISHNKAFKSDS